jgi:hypothetical protein
MAAGAWGLQLYHLHVQNVLKSGNLNPQEPSGPVQTCKSLALPFTFLYQYHLQLVVRCNVCLCLVKYNKTICLYVQTELCSTAAFIV